MAEETPPRGDHYDQDPLEGLRRRGDVLMRQVGFDLALYDPTAQTMHILNPVAAAIWHHITPDRTLKNIVDALSLSFGPESCDSREVTDDVLYAIRSLERVNLLVSSSDPDPEPDKKHEAIRLAIPDREISSFTGYSRPTFKSYGLAELEEIFSLNKDVPVPFADLASGGVWTSVV